MQARLLPHNHEEITRLHEMGMDDPNRVLKLDDLVKGDDCIFSATAITDCTLMNGVRFFGSGCRTHTLLLRPPLQDGHGALHRHHPPLRRRKASGQAVKLQRDLVK